MRYQGAEPWDDGKYFVWLLVAGFVAGLLGSGRGGRRRSSYYHFSTQSTRLSLTAGVVCLVPSNS